MNKITTALLCASVLNMAHANTDSDEVIVSQTKLGGYGELHLNGILPEEGKAAAPGLDFHRFVLFFAHQFNSEFSFNSELELEHNYVEGGEATGELELEQAYVEWRPNNSFYMQGGVLLFPIGLINRYHEPARFLSVERPDYNKVIVPSTWFGNGYSIGGESHGLQYQLLIAEGLDHSKVRAKDGIRAGRQKGYKSSFSTTLTTLALDYTGFNGLLVGGSISRSQYMGFKMEKDVIYDNISLMELHLKYKANNIWVSGELGRTDYEALNSSVGLLESGAGGYVDVGYNVASFLNTEELELYPWVRYGNWDPATGKEGGVGESGYSEIRLGLALLPIPQVAVKADYSFEEKQDGKKQNSYNFGVGYDF